MGEPRVKEWVIERPTPVLDEYGYTTDPGPMRSRFVLEQNLSGPLEGWTAEVELWLDDRSEDEPTFNPSTPRLQPIRLVPPADAGLDDLTTQRALREVHLGHVRNWVRDYFEETRRTAKGRGAAAGVTLTTAWLDSMARGRKPGRATHPRIYAMWAARRVEGQAARPKAPIKWMVDRYGGTERAANAYVFRAREKGMFEEGKPLRLSTLAESLLEVDGDVG